MFPCFLMKFIENPVVCVTVFLHITVSISQGPQGPPGLPGQVVSMRS